MAVQSSTQRIQAWSLMHEAILEIDARHGLECEEGQGSLTDEDVLDAAHKLREIGDSFNKEYSNDGEKQKTRQEVEVEIANLLKEKAQEIQEKYGRELDNLFRVDSSIFQSGVLGSIYSLMSSRLAGLLNPQAPPKENMGFLYHIVKGMSLAVLPGGIQTNDLPVELKAINAMSAQFLLDKCMPATVGPDQSLVEMINAVD